MPINWGEVAEVCAIAGLGIYTGVDKWIAKKAQKRIRKMELDAGLDTNPHRCEDHELRLRAIEKSVSSIDKCAAVIETRLEGVERRLDNIGGLFNLAGDKTV